MRHRRALAWFALFQACIAKRPYNLFHRRNLDMRTADVGRTFGNKAAWDRPFEVHFRKYARQANAAVFDNALPCTALILDVALVRSAGMGTSGHEPDQQTDRQQGAR